MALQRVEIVYDVDSKQLELATEEIREQAKLAGIAESEVAKLNDEYADQAKQVTKIGNEQKKQLGIIQQLRQEEQKLTNARDQSLDENEIKKFNSELIKTRTEIKRLTVEAGKLENELDEVGRNRLGGLKSGLSDIASIATGGLLAGGISSLIEGIVSGFSQLASESIELFDIQATADEQLRVGLESTGNVVGRTVEQLKQQASELQNITLFGDEQTQGAQSILLTFTNIREEIFDRTVPAVQDIATRLNTDLTSAALQVGKALNEPVQGLSALSRAGVQFSDEQESLIKSLVAAGDTAAAQTIILEELETQFGGAAEAAARAGAGGITQLENKISDVKEEIGAGLIPIQERAREIQLSFIQAIADTVKAFTEFFGISTKLSESTQENQIEFNSLIQALNNSNESLNEVGVSEEILASRQENRNEILNEINSKYGEYLPNLLTEASSIGEIEAAQRAANEAFRERITLLARQEQLEEVTRNAVEIQRELLEVNRRIAEVQTGNIGSAALVGGNAGQILINLRREAANLEEQLQSLQDEAASIQPVVIQSEGAEETVDEIEEVDKIIDQVNNKTATAKIQLEPGTEAFINAQIKELERQLEFEIPITARAQRADIRAQIEQLQQQLTGTVLEVGEISPPEPIKIEFEPVIPPSITADQVISASESDSIKERTDLQLELQIQKIAELQTALSNFSSTLSFDSGGLVELFQNLDFENISTGDVFAGLSAGISTANEALNQFSENRIQRKELEKQALVKLEEETGQSQASAIAEVDAEIAEIERRRFIRNKITAIAEAAIATSLGIAKSLPNVVLAAIVGALGAVQIGIIASQPVPFKEGVFALGKDSKHRIPGPGTGTSDSIPAMISRGESVLTEKDTNTFSSHIKAISEGKKPTWFTFGNTSLLGFDMPESDRKTLESILNAGQSNMNAIETSTNAFERMPLTHEPMMNAIAVNVNSGGMQNLDYEKLANALATKMNSVEISSMWKDGHLMKAMYNEMIKGNELQIKILTDIANANNIGS